MSAAFEAWWERIGWAIDRSPADGKRAGHGIAAAAWDAAQGQAAIDGRGASGEDQPNCPLTAKPEPVCEPEPYSEAWWRSAPVVAELAKRGISVVGAEPVSARPASEPTEDQIAALVERTWREFQDAPGPGNEADFGKAVAKATVAALTAPGAVQQAPEGWKLVPIEPTVEMLSEMAKCDGYWPEDQDRPGLTLWEDYWRMAIAATPDITQAPSAPISGAKE